MGCSIAIKSSSLCVCACTSKSYVSRYNMDIISDHFTEKLKGKHEAIAKNQRAAVHHVVKTLGKQNNPEVFITSRQTGERFGSE